MTINSGPNWRWITTILVSILGTMIGTLAWSFNSRMEVVEARSADASKFQSVTETHWIETDRKLSRIETQLDRLMERKLYGVEPPGGIADGG